MAPVPHGHSSPKPHPPQHGPGLSAAVSHSKKKSKRRHQKMERQGAVAQAGPSLSTETMIASSAPASSSSSESCAPGPSNHPNGIVFPPRVRTLEDDARDLLLTPPKKKKKGGPKRLSPFADHRPTKKAKTSVQENQTGSQMVVLPTQTTAEKEEETKSKQLKRSKPKKRKRFQFGCDRTGLEPAIHMAAPSTLPDQTTSTSTSAPPALQMPPTPPPDPSLLLVLNTPQLDAASSSGDGQVSDYSSEASTSSSSHSRSNGNTTSSSRRAKLRTSSKTAVQNGNRPDPPTLSTLLSAMFDPSLSPQDRQAIMMSPGDSSRTTDAKWRMYRRGLRHLRDAATMLIDATSRFAPEDQACPSHGDGVVPQHTSWMPDDTQSLADSELDGYVIYPPGYVPPSTKQAGDVVIGPSGSPSVSVEPVMGAEEVSDTDVPGSQIDTVRHVPPPANDFMNFDPDPLTGMDLDVGGSESSDLQARIPESTVGMGSVYNPVCVSDSEDGHEMEEDSEESEDESTGERVDDSQGSQEEKSPKRYTRADKGKGRAVPYDRNPTFTPTLSSLNSPNRHNYFAARTSASAIADSPRRSSALIPRSLKTNLQSASPVAQSSPSRRPLGNGSSLPVIDSSPFEASQASQASTLLVTPWQSVDRAPAMRWNRLSLSPNTPDGPSDPSPSGLLVHKKASGSKSPRRLLAPELLSARAGTAFIIVPRPNRSESDSDGLVVDPSPPVVDHEQEPATSSLSAPAPRPRNPRPQWAHVTGILSPAPNQPRPSNWLFGAPTEQYSRSTATPPTASRPTAVPPVRATAIPPSPPIILGLGFSREGGFSKLAQRILEAVNHGGDIAAATITLNSMKRTVGTPLTVAQRDKDLRERLEFRQTMDLVREKCPNFKLVAHAVHTTNLASKDPLVMTASYHSVVTELQQARALDVETLVFHLGSNDSEDPAIVRTRVAGLMKRALEEVPGVNLAIENMTGRCKGETSASLRNLKAIIDEVDMPGRLKVCLDICHVYISQYDLYDEACADDFLEDIAELGPENIAAMHVSDSYVPHGSKRDEHACIGFGMIPLDAFRRILRSDTLKGIPCFLETPDCFPANRNRGQGLPAIIDEIQAEINRNELEFLTKIASMSEEDWELQERIKRDGDSDAQKTTLETRYKAVKGQLEQKIRKKVIKLGGVAAERFEEARKAHKVKVSRTAKTRSDRERGVRTRDRQTDDEEAELHHEHCHEGIGDRHLCTHHQPDEDEDEDEEEDDESTNDCAGPSSSRNYRPANEDSLDDDYEEEDVDELEDDDPMSSGRHEGGSRHESDSDGDVDLDDEEEVASLV